MKFDEDKALSWLKRYDKHLWGLNATYKQASRMAVGLDFSPSKMQRTLWCISFTEETDDQGEVKKIRHVDWEGVVSWWKNPEGAPGPKKPTLGVALTMKAWDQTKGFVAEHRELLMQTDSTIAFAVRLMCSYWLPANEHIITEIFNSRKMPLRKEPGNAP